MNKPILYYVEGCCQHVDHYHIGPAPCCPCPCPPPSPSPINPGYNYHGKVDVVAKTVLKVKYISKNGHYESFDIEEGQSYEFTAVSATKGLVTFKATVKDFESTKLDKILSAPHEAAVDNLILDASDMYESKLIRISVSNIVAIKPITVFASDTDYPYIPDTATTDTSDIDTTTCTCGCNTSNTSTSDNSSEDIINPFA